MTNTIKLNKCPTCGCEEAKIITVTLNKNECEGEELRAVNIHCDHCNIDSPKFSYVYRSSYSLRGRYTPEANRDRIKQNWENEDEATQLAINSWNNLNSAQ